MLKFSGFADLTSCLEISVDDRLHLGAERGSKQQKKERSPLFKLLAADAPCAAHVRSTKNPLTGKHSNTAGLIPKAGNAPRHKLEPRE